MFSAKKMFVFVAAAASAFIILFACKSLKNQPKAITGPGNVKNDRILVFIKTKGYYHESIPAGAAAMRKLGDNNNFEADTTSDASYFTEDSLKNYRVVMFLNTTMNVLNADQQVAFERYIQAGGGFMGVHAATDTEYDWPWYNKLVGAYFASHPKQQNATIHIIDKNHPATSFLPESWTRYDEWYNFKNVQPDIHVIANLDESTYEGGTMGDNHPFAWYHEFDGGRAFYTAGGHTKESYSDTLFMKHILGGITYAMGNKSPLDYSKSYSVKAPEDNRFTKTVLSNDLNEPMELTVAPDGRVFFTERAGKLYVYNPVSKKTNLLYDFPAKAVEKYLNGLIGITIDPDFTKNNYLYVFYSSSTGEQFHQNISRFTLTSDGALDTISEKIIIKIPIDLEVSAHTGGSLAWDKYNNLYISTGDNTVPFESDGYAPIDERTGRNIYDAQRSAANTNDLRGKILRIHPQADGSYTIPEGNLFPKGTPGTRPEIYVMGCRNPYRISVDTATSIIYWGEVGPDAGRDSRHGPRGYDEFNQARKPGNFGWPYFVGNNIAYNDSNFATKAIGDLFNVERPVNNSPNNKGIEMLPRPQVPMVWYPYNQSEEFPSLGDGGRCAMGGPYFHYQPALQSPFKMPAYFDKTLFVYDWMRNWVFAVRMDSAYNFKRLEPFMQSNGDFRRPVDLEIGPNGVMYMLEYGSVYGIDNDDARLVRIEYNAGNRSPVSVITTKDTIGNAPYKVNLSADKSYDFDEADNLTYKWSLEGKAISTNNKFSHAFDKPGKYQVVLTVSDPSGANSSDSLNVIVGNTLPRVAIQASDNSTFFFNKRTALNYKVNVNDSEDVSVDKRNMKVNFKYIPKVAASQKEIGHQEINADYNLGKILLSQSDCKACHQMDAKSVGPSFLSVSKRYSNDKAAIGLLANKVITGGAGVWGEHAMNAHPQLSKEEATEIVKYVLSLSQKQEEKILDREGTVTLDLHAENNEEGRYILTASYTDKGGAANIPLTTREILVLRPSKVPAVDADALYNLERFDGGLGKINDGSYFVLKNIDLKDVNNITLRITSDKDAAVNVHLDSRKGKVISSIPYKSTGGWDKFSESTASVNDPGGKHDLYFVFEKGNSSKDLGVIKWIRFEGGKEVAENVSMVSQGKNKKIKPAVDQQQNAGKITKAINSSPANTGAVLLNKSDCKTCHSPDQKLLGPSYKQIAARYKNEPALVKKLAGKIINGGAGVWGDIPMPPHPQLSVKDASAIVRYILSLKSK